MKTKLKKALTALLSFSMLASSLTAVNAAYSVTGSQVTQGHWETGSDGAKHYIYFYDQLSPEAKRFYNALVTMYEDGILKTGTEAYDLTANDVVTQDQLYAYTTGDNSLVNTYGAARDAFYADYPDAFYVNFDNLSITVKQKSDETFTASLGAGRTENYYREGFSSAADVDKAVSDLNAEVEKLREIASDAVKMPDETTPPATDAPQTDASATPNPDATPIVLDLDDLRPGTSDEEKYRPKTDQEKMVTAVHDAMIRNTVYKLDTADQNDPKHCKLENIGNVRTAYGPLVAHESLCEGYSKALKLVLDRIGVPCVTVQGVYKHTEEQMELHMWNYVKIHEIENEVWYAVDSTFDDPSVFNGENMNDVNSGHESSEYLLVGADIMDRQHIESGEMSECGFEFKYPVLEMSGVSFDTVYSVGGLDVQYSSDCNAAFGTNMGSATPAFKVSYNGKGYVKAAREDNMYILVKFYGRNYETEGDEFTASDWIYADTGLYDPQGLGNFENDGYILFPVWQAQYMEFAVTDIPPRGHWYPGQKIPENPQIPDPEDDKFGLEQAEYQYYTGDPLMLVEETGMLLNHVEVEYLPPFVQRSTPSMSGRFYIEDGSKDCEIVFDKPLQKKGASAVSLADEDSETEIPLEYLKDYTVSVYDKTDNAALGNVKVDKVVTDMRLVGDRTIKMTLTPDDSWAGDTIAYDINITGLESKIGNLQPVTISFVTSHRAAVCAYRSRGYFFNLFAKPQLMENTDISVNDWKTSDGSPVDQSLSNRIALVVSETNKNKGDAMNSMIEEKTGSDVLSSSTYDLSLTICNKNILSTGTSVRLCVGFPAPYGPEDEGVKFTAYHFKKDSQGNTVDVEEIPCEVTKYGLVILCKSFSPFAIVASEMTEEEKAQQKSTVTVFNNAGGKIVSADTAEDGLIYAEKDGKAPEINIIPDEGYAIDTIFINGEAQPVPENKGDDTTVAVAWTEGVKNTIINVTFAKTATLEKEEAEAELTGETIIKPAPPAVMGSGKTLTGTISAEDGAISAEIVNTSAEFKANAQLIVALYKDNRLQSVRSETAEIGAKATRTITVENIEGIEDVDSVKAFLWGIDSVYPIDKLELTASESASN